MTLKNIITQKYQLSLVKLFILLLIIFFNLSCVEHNSDASSDLVGLIERGDDIYIGEIHGTNEIPKLIFELVEIAVGHNHTENIAVILELPSEARDFSSFFWQGRDGRSSAAMASLVESLIELESDGKIALYFQLDGYDFSNFNIKSYEEHLGKFIDKKTDSYQVIAYGGSAHSSRDKLNENAQYYPAGYYIRNITSVYIMPNQKYSFWGCTKEGCSEVSAIPPDYLMLEPGLLINGKTIKHEHIHIVEGLTSSPPYYSYY